MKAKRLVGLSVLVAMCGSVIILLVPIMTVVSGCSPGTGAAPSQPGAPRSPIKVSVIGTTNGVVGITNGSWTIYSVTNHTTNSFPYLGSRIEIKRGDTWILEPRLEPTEVGGWLSPPTLTWNDGPGTLNPTSSFHVYFRARGDSAVWRASLRFIPLGKPRQYYDCPIPEISE